MKKEIVMWLIVAVLVVGTLLSTQKAETMAIDFETSSYQEINFGTLTPVRNLASKSICVWLKPESDMNSSVVMEVGRTGGAHDEFYGVGVGVLASNKVSFTAYWNSTSVQWRTTSDVISSGNWHFVCVTYSNSSAANDPIIYIDGNSVAITETVGPPTGAYETGTGGYLTLGGNVGGSINPFDGLVTGVRIYNRILTSDEILKLYNSRGADNIRNGLVFCPFLKGAAGLQAFDGATLAAGNTIVDPCSGAVGVPAGNPVGVGETYLVR